MTTTEPILRPCPTCQHLLDGHVILMVLTDPAPMGVMICPSCPCSSTWRATTTASTPEQVSETRRLITEQLLHDGKELPGCLR